MIEELNDFLAWFLVLFFIGFAVLIIYTELKIRFGKKE